MTRALIVDDEAPARQVVREALADLAEADPDGAGGAVEVVGECANGSEAVAAVVAAERAGRPVGLLFLDVQMPVLSGFEVLDELAARGIPAPPVVFSTAFDRHAVQAFEVAAVDYLLKPFTQARFEEAVRRALAAASDAERPAARAVEVLRGDRPYPAKLLVEDGGVFVPVPTADVVWAEAAGDYTKLHTLTAGGGRKTYLAGQGIGTLAERLDPTLFARVHRSAVVALDALRAVERDGHGGFVARLADGATVRVSRTYADVVRDLIA